MSQLRIAKVVLTSVCLIGFALPVCAQQTSKTTGILGRLNPQTGAFTPAHLAPLVDPETAPAPHTGTLTFTLTVTIKSPIATASTLSCTATADVMDNETSEAAIRDIIQTATTTVALAAKATSAKCTVTIPYSWTLVTPTLDSINLSYGVTQYPTTTTTTVLTVLQGYESFTEEAGSIAVPAAAGAVTALNYAVTI